MYTDNDRYHDICSQFERLGLITSLNRIIKQGKEGSVLLCDAHRTLSVEYCVIKVYRDAEYRNFRNDKAYLGGKVWKRRDLAHLNATKNSLWVDTEFDTLTKLYEADIPVPRPYDRIDRAICMEYIGEGDTPAPMLKEIRLDATEAKQAFSQLSGIIDSMLGMSVIHADLSAFNILYHKGRVMVIDFPQSVSADTNPDAFSLFSHDVTTVCEYFTRLGFETDTWAMTKRIWSRYYRMP